MAFTVEDGTGMDDATAYVDDADVDAYAADRGGVAAWTAANEAAKQAAIVRATDYLDQAYGARMRGSRLEDDQALEFPRECAYDKNGVLIEGVPVALEKACCEAALLAIAQPLVFNPAAPVTSAGAPRATTPIVRELKRVEGAITKEIEYAQPTSNAVATGELPIFPAIDRLMRPLLYPAGVVRA